MSNRRTIHDWLAEYSHWHQDETNKLVHWVCVPLIMYSLLGLMWEIPLPAAVAGVSPWLNVATVFVALCLVFYFSLSTSIAVGMGLVSLAMLLVIATLDRQSPGIVWKVSLAVFVVAWLGQFVGHRIEGQKPAFLKDLQFLLIGPAWLLADVYRRTGIW